MASPTTTDTSTPLLRVSRIGFGSCNNQRLVQQQKEVFQDLLPKRDLDVFVYSGDVVYSKHSSLEALKTAYQQLEDEGSFRRFQKSLPGGVLGTWDDHDFGVNDGGREVPQLTQRRDLFLDFLQVDKHDPRRFRKGVYSSHDFGKGNETVRIILLDTRFGRSAYPLSWLGAFGEGKWYGKPFAVLSSIVRAMSTMSGWTEYYAVLTNQQILDRAQWAWLEQQLASSPAQVNILVSSVQVLTLNPTVESWGHFPFELKRLLKLIKKTKPNGFLIVSGDVHIGEALSIPDSPPVEVTSSGLTHSCTTHFPALLCSYVWGAFASESRVGIMYARNFGEVEIDWAERMFHVSVRNIQNMSGEYIQFSRTFEPISISRIEHIPSIIPNFQTQTAIFFLLCLQLVVVFHCCCNSFHRERRRRH